MTQATHIQEVAITVVLIASTIIIVAVPFAILGSGASWRDRAMSALTVLEALIAAARRVLGVSDNVR